MSASYYEVVVFSKVWFSPGLIPHLLCPCGKSPSLLGPCGKYLPLGPWCRAARKSPSSCKERSPFEMQREEMKQREYFVNFQITICKFFFAKI